MHWACNSVFIDFLKANSSSTYSYIYVANLVPQPWQEAPKLDFMC